MVEPTEQDNLFFAEDKDEQMNRAMEKARLTLGYFRTSLENPAPGQEFFSLKIRVDDAGTVEHMWLSEVGLDEKGNFTGILSNEPQFVKSVQEGLELTVADADVSDWMVVENDRLIGGYTIRAYRDQLNMADQVDFDDSFGWTIDEGMDPYPAVPTTPEGAILALEEAYSAGDLEKAVTHKDFLTEARHMLARMTEMPQDDGIVQYTAEALEMAFRDFWTDQEMPDFSDVERAFPEKEYEDENTVLVTEICTHPDGEKTMDKLWVYRVNGIWKVGPPANEEP